MLKFTPPNYVSLTPNSQERLEGSFVIANPSSNASAPFKIKSTSPELFVVKPYVGVLLPLEQLQISVTTLAKSSPELTREIAHQHKFLIEYALLDRAPASLADGLQKITQNNRQSHKLYLNTNTARGSLLKDDAHEARSALSNRQSYRSVYDHHPAPSPQAFEIDSLSYEQLSSEGKFERLKAEIDKLEKERSEVIMAQPTRNRPNLIKIVLIAIIMLVLGNLLGKSVGLPRLASGKQKSKKREEDMEFRLRDAQGTRMVENMGVISLIQGEAST